MATKKVKKASLEEVLLKVRLTDTVLREKDTERQFLKNWPDTSTEVVSYYVPEIKDNSDGMYCEFNVHDGGSSTASLSFNAYDGDYTFDEDRRETSFEDRLSTMLENVDNFYLAVKNFRDSVNEAASTLKIARKVNK